MTWSLIWEWSGVITALIYVFLASKGQRSCFIFGLISSVVFLEITFSDRLFFDALINAYYVIMSFVGWFQWKSSDGEIHPRSIKRNTLVILIVSGIILAYGLALVFEYYFNSSLAHIDAFTTVMAVIATWMMVQKYLENWLIWVVADGISIYMYTIKDHLPIAGLFIVYTLISVFGYFNWKKKMQVAVS